MLTESIILVISLRVTMDWFIKGLASMTDTELDPIQPNSFFTFEFSGTALPTSAQSETVRHNQQAPKMTQLKCNKKRHKHLNRPITTNLIDETCRHIIEMMQQIICNEQKSSQRQRHNPTDTSRFRE